MDETLRMKLAQRFMALDADKRELFLARLRSEGLLANELPIPRGEPADAGPLSHAQERLWFLWRLEPESAAYNIAGALRLRGRLQLPALAGAFDDLFARHESLRTELREHDGRASQYVTDASLGPLPYVDVASATQPLMAAEAYARKLALEPFELTRAPLLRAAVLRLAAADHVLCVCVHHVIADGWSLDVAIRELVAAYAARVQEQPLRLPPPGARYVDYARFSRAVLTDAEVQRLLEPQRKALGDVDQRLELPLATATAAISDTLRENEREAAGVQLIALPQTLVARLDELARQHNSTLFTWLLSGFSLLLFRYSGQRALRVGVPVANRSRSQLQGVLGLFVNTLVVPIELRGERSFTAHALHVEDALRSAQAQQELPFERLVDALAPARSLDRNPLFQVLYNHQTRETRALASMPELAVEPLPWGAAAAQVDLALDTEQDSAGILRARFSYARERLSAASVAELAEHFLALLTAAAREPDRRVSALAPSPAQPGSASPLEAATAPSSDRRDFVPVTQLIRQQAQLRPEAPALCSDTGEAHSTYRELIDEAERRARRLRAYAQTLTAAAPVEPEVLVAVCLPRSPRLIAAELAVLEAGFAFVPIDPELPHARIAELLTAAQPLLVWTDETLRERFGRLPSRQVLTTQTLDALSAAGAGSPRPLAPDQLAYVIFTSGSTGTPKGVAMTHGSLSMHCQAIALRYAMRPDDRALHFAAASFDASIEQWISPLISGAALVVRGPELYSAERALDVLREQAVTWFEMPPAYFTEVCRAALERGQQLRLRACSVGGEAVTREAFDLMQRALGAAPLVNGYGPTETAITPLVWTAGPGDGFAGAYAPIGSAVGARHAYVLDLDLCPVPNDVIGELYLGGAGLARGYLRRPGMSAERFVPDPFAGAGGRMYRTGDLVRRRADGVMEFVGRADHQVKLRGFRIELGEIEARLLGCDGVREAVVIARDSERGKQLVAYVATAHGSAREPSLREALAAQLPSYMLPAAIVCLPELPHTASGKVDRRALPTPQLGAARRVNPPQGRAEQALAGIWGELLGVSEVFAHDNFFEQGGDSIIALQLISRARRLGLGLTPKDVFVHQSLRALAAAAIPLTAPTEPAEVEWTADAPLTPIQHAFFAQSSPRPDHDNQALLLDVRAALDLPRLTRALAALVEQHAALRLRFMRSPTGVLSQRSAPPSAASELLSKACARDMHELLALCEAAQRSLNLAHGALLRGLYVELENGGGARLLLVIHHIAVDGVSWRVLLEDLLLAYAQLETRDAVCLPPKTAPYARFATALSQFGQDAALQHAELAYYTRELSGVHASLPERRADDSDNSPKQALYRDLERVHCALSQSATARLLRQAPSAYRTHVQELLVTALARALGSLTGQPRALVELESHGRQAAELLDQPLDVSRTVGWFTSLAPVCLDASGELAQCIPRIKEQLRGLPRHGLGFGLLAQHGSQSVQAALAQLPAPRITFNYLGQFGQGLVAQQLFAPAHESVGALRDPDAPLGNWLEINGQVYDDALALSLAFSPRIYERETIEALRDAFMRELDALIEHCCTPGVGVLTPSDVPLGNVSQSALDRLCATRRGLEDVYPLTPLQRGMLFESLLAPELATYVAQLDLRVEALDVPRFVAAWKASLDQHPSLRSAFVYEAAGLAEPLQAVVKRAPIPVEELDLRGQARDTSLEARLLELCEREQARGFDLQVAPLMRLLLVRLDGGAYHVIWTHHHLLLDGWSTSLLLGEVLQRYAGSAVPPAAGSYRDYVRWLAARAPDASKRYFQALLSRVDARARLASASALSTQRSGAAYQKLRIQLDATQTEQLGQFARREHVTVNSVVQAAFGYLLQRYTASAGALFGVTVAGRPPELPGSELLLGMFINTVPVHVRAGAFDTVSELVHNVQRDNAELREHEHTPLYEIQRWAERPGEALFDALLVFENYPASRALEAHRDVLAVSQFRSSERTQYALTLAVALGAELRLDFGFTTALTGEFVSQFATRFAAVLEQFVAGPVRKLGALDVFGTGAQHALPPCAAFANAGGQLVHAKIAQHAEVRPSAPALYGPSGVLSYAGLRAQVLALHAELIKLGVGAEQRVGICCPRSPEALVAVLAVWETGAAFVPLDPDLPLERLRWLAEDAALQALITTRTTRSRAAAAVAVATLCIDDLALPRTAAGSQPPAAALDPRQLAYVLYTSGTTGKPKGVAVCHGELAAHCAGLNQRYEASATDRALLFAPLTFDATFDQWLAPLTQGAEVHVMDEVWGPARMYSEARARGLTWIHTPPSYMRELAREAHERGPLPALRLCVVGGEAVTTQALAEIQRDLSPEHTINSYGPTEVVVTASTWSTAETALPTAYAPLGTATAQRALRVLDAYLEPVPTGVTGELFIVGPVLARGYHARPGLTAERFLPAPGGGRFYRTGDRARLLPDGTLEFLGRSDHQVKLRGVRVELGELEATLLAEPGVREAVALVRELNGAQSLIAYVASSTASPDALEGRALRERLRQKLPVQLVPAQVLVLDALPRTAAGKLDRKQLEAVPLARRMHRPPESDTAKRLAALFEELLGATQLGLDDEFFELGGDSLLAMRLCARVKHELDVDLTLPTLFEAPSIGGLSERIAQLAPGGAVQDSIEDALAELQDLGPEALSALLQTLDGEPT